MKYLKAFTFSMIFVVLLTVAQYGSVHLLTRRPASWLFELSLDLAPPLMFAGDLAQATYTHSSQAPLREQMPALAFGLVVNIVVYATLAIVITWLFLPKSKTGDAFSAGQRTI
jgi:hypothetical protein